MRKQRDLIDENFKELVDEFYPGSRQKRHLRRREKPAEKLDKSWDASPVKRTVQEDGKPVIKEFFYIGALAAALGRKPNTIRAWIQKGWLPKAMYATSRVAGTRGDASRRLWTRAQIENTRRIAQEEGLLGHSHWNIPNSDFTKRVMAGFRSWR
jgi:hypothetical protein